MAERILAYISGTRFFPKTDLCKNTAYNKNFHYSTNPEKINDQVFLCIKKKLIFWPIFDVSSIFGAKNLMIQFQENTQTDGRRDPISQDPSGYRQGSNNYNCSRLAFKSQRYRVQFGLTKNYFVTISTQKISSIHKLIFKIQQILGSHDLNGHAYF